MPEVRIISRLPAQLTDGSGVPKPALAVTYSTAAVPPRTITLLGEDVSDDEVAAAIRDDLAQAEAGPPSTLVI